MPDHPDATPRSAGTSEATRAAGDRADATTRRTGERGDATDRPAGDRSDEAFRALADPTRRRMLDLLAERGTLSVGELAAEFPDLVFSGISKHLMALRAAGLVTATKQGRRQLYRIDESGFTAALAPWVARYEAYWSTALSTLRDLAESPEDPPS
jgi:DNA-binding transcriptional ArsR family regulator